MESQRVTASGLVYLFGDDFVHLPGSAFLGGQTLLAHRGRAVVQTSSLAYKLFEAAFVSLAAQGYISLEMEKTDLPLPLARPPVAIFPQSEGADLPPSLERAIMDVLWPNPKENWVQAVVRRVIGSRWDPSERVVRIVIEGLVRTGWLFERGVEPTEEERALLATFAAEAEVLKARLHAFAWVNCDLHQRLVRDVQAGIGSSS